VGLPRYNLPGRRFPLPLLVACGLEGGDPAGALPGQRHTCADLDMVLVGDPHEPGAFCINPYEATYQVLNGGTPGKPDLSVQPVGVIVRSALGAYPSFGYSFLQWRAVCASSGAHLVKIGEWMAAGSGTLDPAAVWRYPYSQHGPWERGACNLVPDDNSRRSTVLRPNGGFPRCVNPIQAATGDGVFDLLGNLWEFTDPGWNFSAEAFFAAPHSVPCRQEDGRVMHDGPDARRWIEATSLTVSRDVLRFRRGVAEDGTATTRIPANAGWVFDPQDPPRGYLVYEDEPEGPLAMLPIVFSPWRTEPDGAVLYAYLVDTSREGQPIVEKVGAAMYSGTWAYTLLGQPIPGHPDRFHNDMMHTPDFSGTVGARCVVPVSEVDAAFARRAQVWERYHGADDTPLDASQPSEPDAL
jgi:hypothetical protein